MNPSLRVFLCGTSVDLADEREAVLGAIERLGLRRDSMELFGSRTDRPIDVCLQEVRQSDVLVVIVAHMYGTLVPEMGISFSEAEYREGYSGGKPCLIYLKSEDVPTLPKHFEPDAHKRDLLGKYKALLQARHTCSAYKDAATLAVQVIADLSRTKEQIAAGGLTPHVLPSSGPILHTADLAKLQDATVAEVWVYAPYPLETFPHGAHRALRRKVFENLMSGVKYLYFVESEAGVSRIKELLRLMAGESGDATGAIAKLKGQTTVAVLTPSDFLTHYTMHRRAAGEIDVFQSLITPDRNDDIMKLSDERAKHIHALISARMSTMTEAFVDGLRVLRLHAGNDVADNQAS